MAQVTAAALLFRTLTYGIQIPLGGFTYVVWQRRSSWRAEQDPQRDEVSVAHG